MKTQLDLAMALRTAADFCEDPASPKTHGRLCDVGLAWDGATSWCAIGRVEHQLGEHLVGNLISASDRTSDWVRHAADAFDVKDYSRSARILRAQAAKIEAALPVAETVACVGS